MQLIAFCAVLIFMMAASPQGNNLAVLIVVPALVLILFVVKADHSKLWK